MGSRTKATDALEFGFAAYRCDALNVAKFKDMPCCSVLSLQHNKSYGSVVVENLRLLRLGMYLGKVVCLSLSQLLPITVL